MVLGQAWVSSGKNLFPPNLWFKPVKNSKNQNAGTMERYEEFLFTAAAIYYLKCANVPHINHHFQQKKLHVLG